MTSSYSVKNFRASHFEYKDLDKIRGVPNIDSLLHIFRQLKRNAQSVYTTLGEGQLGYLALVMSDAAFNSIPNSAVFVCPVHPGIFPVQAPPTTRAAIPVTAGDISSQQSQHEQIIRLYNEFQAV